MVIGYSSGWVFTWRMEAWISNIFIIVPIICCLFIHESPDWLMLRGKEEQAMKSLNWLNKNQPQPTDRVSAYIMRSAQIYTSAFLTFSRSAQI